MLVIFSWIGGVFLVILTGILGYREIVRHQLKQLNTEELSSVIAKKKLRYIKQRETEKHVHYLLFWGLGITFFLFCLFYYTLTIQQENSRIMDQLTRASEEVLTLKSEQKLFIQQTPVQEYPEKGLDLEKADWDELFSEKDNRKIQGEIEQMISQKLAPYLGLSTVVLTVDRSTNTVTAAIQNEEKENLDMKSMTTDIVNDLVEIKNLKELTFQTVVLTDGKLQQTGQWHYIRNDKEAFVLEGNEN